MQILRELFWSISQHDKSYDPMNADNSANQRQGKCNQNIAWGYYSHTSENQREGILKSQRK